jgi:hypothetical protein
MGMEPGFPSSALKRVQRVGIMVDDTESTRSSPTWISFPVILFDVVYVSYFCNKALRFL